MLLDHANRCSPQESCAILYGEVDGGGRAVVSDVFLARNEEESSTSFAVSGEELIEAYQRAQRDGVQVVGVFHSHPGSEARPSEKDVRFMEINPVAWVIYSGTDLEFRAFVYDGAGPREIGIVR